MKRTAVIFDLDGTLIDNNAYHIEAWKVFYKNLNRELTMEEYKTSVNGRINREIFNYIFQKELPEEDIERYTREKEELYRELYASHIKPIEGLVDFLQELHEAGIRMAVATS